MPVKTCVLTPECRICGSFSDAGPLALFQMQGLWPKSDTEPVALCQIQESVALCQMQDL